MKEEDPGHTGKQRWDVGHLTRLFWYFYLKLSLSVITYDGFRDGQNNTFGLNTEELSGDEAAAKMGAEGSIKGKMLELL